MSSQQCHTILHILGWLLSNLVASSLTFQNWTNKCHKLYITGIPFSTSIQPSMSHLSHITLSLPIPLPFPQLVTCPQHPKPGRGSPNFLQAPLNFSSSFCGRNPGCRTFIGCGAFDRTKLGTFWKGVFGTFAPFSDETDFTAAIPSAVAFRRCAWLSWTVLTPISHLGGMTKGNRFGK